MSEALCALDSTSYEEDVKSLRQIRVHAKEHHRVLLSSLNTCSVTSSTIIPLQHVLCTGSPGRPPLIVNIEQVELLHSAEVTWEQVAQLLGVCHTTLWWRFQELGIPNVGVSMLQGYLKCWGVYKMAASYFTSVLFSTRP